MIDGKKIAKNTAFMYMRMILILGVTLYTSRVVLDKLGVDDFGLYNVIFGLIGMLSFLNGTLSIGTSRFLTFELGTKNEERLKSTFSTALVAHIFLAIIILLLGETIGLWYVNNILVVPPDRMFATHIVYQISILSTCITILQVPFTASIIAHERMNIYAYIGIFDAFGRLFVIFMLNMISSDKLILYAALTFGIHLIVMLFYVHFCYRLFDETRGLRKPELNILKSILKFSGWNIVANISNTLLSEGVILLFNLFFQPVVVAAQAVSKQISMGLMSFINNVRVAVNPQITKLYANGNYEESKKLTLRSAEYIFYLLLLLGVPCIMVMPTLLDIWLVEVPDYAVAFARLIVLQNILDNFNAAFYTPMTAANKIEKNSIAAVVVCFSQFVVLYVLFHWGSGPLWARYIGIFSCILFSYLIKPYILYKDINYSIKEIYSCIFQCLKVGSIVAVITLFIYYLIPQNSVAGFLTTIVLSVFAVILVSFCLAEQESKTVIISLIKHKLKKK